jgi:hypothetical protein
LFEIGEVDVSGDGCWLWRGPVHSGYPRHPETGAHRLALILSGHDPVPGREACHTCDVKLCVRPSHLYWGTHSQNIQDQHDRGLRHYSDDERARKSKDARDRWATMDPDERARIRALVSEAALERERRKRES